MIKNNSLYNTPVRQVNNFHEIEDIDERRAFLKSSYPEKLSNAQISYYLELIDHRYEKKGNQWVDRYMRSFMMLLTMNRASGLGFLNNKRKKEVASYLDELDLNTYSALSDSAQENAEASAGETLSADEKSSMLKEEWADCAACFISSCTSSKSYGSAFLGMIPMPDKNVAMKIAADIDTALNIVPDNYDLKELSAPVYDVFVDTYKKLLENGEALFKEYLSGK